MESLTLSISKKLVDTPKLKNDTEPTDPTSKGIDVPLGNLILNPFVPYGSLNS